MHLHNLENFTEWLAWFLNCLKNVLLETEEVFQKTLYKVEFWNVHKNTEINERQRLVLNKLLGYFFGNLTTSKWAKMTKTSQDTTLRDITDLVKKAS